MKTPSKGFPGKYCSSEVHSPLSGGRLESQDGASDYPSSKYNRYSQLPHLQGLLVSSFHLRVVLSSDFLQDATLSPISSPTFSRQTKLKNGQQISREQAHVMASQLIEEIAVLDRLKSRLVDELGLMQEILDKQVD